MTLLPEPADAPAEAPALEPEPRGLQAWAFPFSVWLGARVTLTLASWIGMKMQPGLQVPTWMSPLYAALPVFEPFCRWDCGFFYLIARDGYTEGWQTNFFPLLPGLTWLLRVVTRIPPQWGMLLVSNLACLAAYRVLYRMFRRLGDEQTARWGLVLFAAYPFAFFHGTGHPESLMVLFSALSLDYATRGQHGRAGLALSVGVLSRHLTLLAGLGLLIAQVQQRPSPRRFLQSPAWLALGLPWLSLLGYLLYQQLAWGDFLAFYKAREKWGELAYWGITDQLRSWGNGEARLAIMYTYLPFAALVLVGLALATRRRDWWPPVAFGLVLAVLSWAVGLWGLGRYSASCWPAFLALGAVSARRPMLGMLMTSGLGVFQGLFFFLYTHQYPVI